MSSWQYSYLGTFPAVAVWLLDGITTAFKYLCLRHGCEGPALQPRTAVERRGQFSWPASIWVHGVWVRLHVSPAETHFFEPAPESFFTSWLGLAPERLDPYLPAKPPVGATQSRVDTRSKLCSSLGNAGNIPGFLPLCHCDTEHGIASRRLCSVVCRHTPLWVCLSLARQRSACLDFEVAEKFL